MSDPFEDSIRKALQQEDQHDPAAGHISRFEGRLESNSTGRSSGSHGWLRIAAVLVPLLGFLTWVSLFLLKSPDDPSLAATTEPKPDTVAEILVPEVEAFFEVELARNLDRVADYNLDEGDPHQGFLVQLDTLEQHYRDLKKQLIQFGENERIRASLIENYRLRLEVLQRLLEQLEKSEKQKNTPHENLS